MEKSASFRSKFLAPSWKITEDGLGTKRITSSDAGSWAKEEPSSVQSINRSMDNEVAIKFVWTYNNDFTFSTLGEIAKIIKFPQHVPSAKREINHLLILKNSITCYLSRELFQVMRRSSSRRASSKK